MNAINPFILGSFILTKLQVYRQLIVYKSKNLKLKRVRGRPGNEASAVVHEYSVDSGSPMLCSSQFI